MEDDAVFLEYFTFADMPRLISWFTSPRLLFQFDPKLSFPLTMPQLEAYFTDFNREGANHFAFKVIHSELGPIGHAELFPIDCYHRFGVISHILVGDENLRGRGYGKRLMELLCEFGFHHLALHRLELLVFAFNTPAIACYEKVGFRKEGLFREKRLFAGEYHSSYIMGLLDREYFQRNPTSVKGPLPMADKDPC